MAYLVKIMPRAERDFAEIFYSINAGQSEAALWWFAGFQRAIFTLEKNPFRCASAPEGRGLRNLLYGRKPHVYRVIFRVREVNRVVEILHIRHGARG